jgi:xanthine dehydrogenase YagR molybdenum-binding subunit
VAASTYGVYQFPASARVRLDPAGLCRVSLAAADPGTGARTVLAQIAADALEVPTERVRLEIGDSALPRVFGAAGSSGTASWGWAIVNAARELRRRLREEFGGTIPAQGIEVSGTFEGNLDTQRFSMHTFGAQFAEVRVHQDTAKSACHDCWACSPPGGLSIPKPPVRS